MEKIGNKRKRLPLIMGILGIINEIWMGSVLGFVIFIFCNVKNKTDFYIEIISFLAALLLVNLYIIYRFINLFLKSNFIETKKYRKSLVDSFAYGLVPMLIGIYLFISWVLG